MEQYYKSTYICKDCLTVNSSFNKCEECLACGKRNLELMDVEPSLQVTIALAENVSITYLVSLTDIQDKEHMLKLFYKMGQVLIKKVDNLDNTSI